jgi:hypothetical protein
MGTYINLEVYYTKTEMYVGPVLCQEPSSDRYNKLGLLGISWVRPKVAPVRPKK